MKKFIIICDSGSDLPNDIVQKYHDDLFVIPMELELDGINYMSYSDEREITNKDFYQKLREGGVSKTSQINTYRFIEIFESFLKQNLDIIYLGFSSGLSGTFNSSLVAKDELLNKYQDAKITCIDSLCASLGEGLLCYLGLKQKENGASYEDVVKFYQNYLMHISHLFTVEDLKFLSRGGRISKTTALIGTIASIKPLMHVTNEGKLTAYGKCIGRKNSLKKLVEKMVQTIDLNISDTIAISHGDCLEDLEFVISLIKEKINPKEIITSYIGPTIGSHSGPGTIAIFYLGNQR